MVAFQRVKLGHSLPRGNLRSVLDSSSCSTGARQRVPLGDQHPAITITLQFSLIENERRIWHAYAFAFGSIGSVPERHLQIAFGSKQLRNWCESEAESRKQFGKEIAAVLIRRLADLEAAPTMADLVIGAPIGNDEDGSMRWETSLSQGYVLVFCANHQNPPKPVSASMEFVGVQRIKITGIERRDA